MVRQQVPLRPYVHPLSTVFRPIDSEESLGPSQGYVFPRYYRDTTIMRMLQKWVTGKLPQSCLIPLCDVYHYTPIKLLAHYNGPIPFLRSSSSIKPVWFFTHLSRSLHYINPTRAITFSNESGHWIEQDGTTEIRDTDSTVMGSKKNAFYYEENSFTRKCWKTDIRMTEYTLARYPDDVRSGIARLTDTKCGEWMIVKIFVTRQKNRNACPFQPRFMRVQGGRGGGLLSR